MIDKKEEYLAEALDEIRDEYIDEAVTYEAKKKRSWKYWATSVAACLVLVVAIGMGVRFAPIESSGDNSGSAGISAPSDGESENPEEMFENKNAFPEDLAEDVGTAEQETGQSSMSLMWYEPEEIVAQNIVIFRGTVESIVSVEGTSLESGTGNVSYTQLTVTVTECLKGDLEKGESCVIKVPVKIEHQNYYDGYYGDLTRLSEGSEAIFMPHVGEPYYFSEGRRYLFLETMEGVSYAEEVYQIPSEGAVTLDDVEEYIRELLQ